jgi:hypothetical protein
MVPMSLKAANIIAVELAILIGLMSWLVYSRLPSAAPLTAAEKFRESTADSDAAVASVLEPGQQHPSTTDYLTNHQQAQLLAEQQALIRYQQEIAPRRYASSRMENAAIAADSPSYAEVEQEPAMVASEDVASPQTVAYVQPAETVVYPQAVQTIVYSQPVQIVVFSNPRRFTNRRRSMPHHGTLPSMANRCRESREPHVNGSTEVESPASPSAALRRPTKSPLVAPRRLASVPSDRPAQEFRARDSR